MNNRIGARLIHICGDDLTVVNAARVSFDKQRTELDNGDIRLIRYLARYNHKSPFNHCFATIKVTAPLFVARQLQKHEYMPWNEISRRYVDTPPAFYEPDSHGWRERSEDKKQGSGSSIPVDNFNVTEAYAQAEVAYNDLLKQGVCPEQARMVLPQSMMTEWFWSGTLYAWSKMCALRLAEDTQHETRQVAQLCSEMLRSSWTYSWDALRTYHDNSNH